MHKMDLEHQKKLSLLDQQPVLSAENYRVQKQVDLVKEK